MKINGDVLRSFSVTLRLYGVLRRGTFYVGISTSQIGSVDLPNSVISSANHGDFFQGFRSEYELILSVRLIFDGGLFLYYQFRHQLRDLGFMGVRYFLQVAE